jgi:hypothetical protein
MPWVVEDSLWELMRPGIPSLFPIWDAPALPTRGSVRNNGIVARESR